MPERETFGPRVKHAREQRGISLESIAERTKVSVSLWAAMERNDVSRWPAGVFARAYIREYAHLVGLDPDPVVDDFCRQFPIADRRIEPLIRGQAEVVGLPSLYADDRARMPSEGDRRRGPAATGTRPASTEAPGLLLSAIGQRTAAALVDIALVLLIAFLAARLSPHGLWSPLAVIGLVYHACGLIALGCTPATALLRQFVGRPVAQQAWRSRRAHA
jgi:transcriptional regulator with XRE-family HTH domain